MARKRGEYQKRLERKMKIGTVCGLLLFCFVILVSVYGIVEMSNEIQGIDNCAYKEYTGSYSYEYRSGRRIFTHGRYSYYKFKLDNGIAFSIDRGSRYCEILDETPEIHVKFLQECLTDRYVAIYVASADGSQIIMSVENTRKSCVTIVWFLSITIVVCSFLSMVFVTLGWEQQIKRFRKKRKKMRKKAAQAKLPQE